MADIIVISENSSTKLIDKIVNYEEVFKDMPITEETICGFWIFKGSFLQRYATKNSYVFIYGILGCMSAAWASYFNGTITSIEKRFKIPSRTTGVISIGSDISQMVGSVLFNYLAGKGHRPRWISFGSYCIVLNCFLTALPHLIYGPGEDALLLTREYGAIADDNATIDVLEAMKDKILCREEERAATCNADKGSFPPLVILFFSHFVSGIGNSIIYTLGVCYMDDNIEKSITPALISLSYFLRLLGPSMGYALASLCLKYYVSPTLTPTITEADPRWLGAWWMGWYVVMIPIAILATLIGCFPKILPDTARRKAVAEAKLNSGLQLSPVELAPPQLPASIKDMFNTLKRLCTNKTYIINNMASVFYCMGYMPYWIYMAKYIEVQYHQSASAASLVTGTVGIVFSAVGILSSGLIITKWKPRARILAAWNIIVAVISVLGLISYIFLGCHANDKNVVLDEYGKLDNMPKCSANCGCDYVQYSPVCSEDNVTTFISACHAGCKDQITLEDGSKIFTECSCIRNQGGVAFNVAEENIWNVTQNNQISLSMGTATPGSCKVDCLNQFYMFLAVVCLLKFTGATGRATNFLVSVRCVDEKDKSVAMGLDLMMLTLFAFMPAPIFFGAILDSTCIVWGKTCTGTGNCWLYNGEQLRYILNLTAATLVAIGTIFDVGVWYYVKDLRIFDEEEKLNPSEISDGIELEPFVAENK